MSLSFRGLAALLALPAVLAVAGPGRAQGVCVAPAPVVSYYAPPAVVAPAPVVTYAAPAVSYYAAPAVSYYAPAPVVTYAAPAVSYYAPAATVTTYRYGLLPRRRVTVANYYSPVYVVP
jgi:hypothetical protein